MLRVLIPVINKDGALQAARHAAFLFAEHCVSEVELMEVLEPPDQGRASAFHSRGALRLQEKRAMLSALSHCPGRCQSSGRSYPMVGDEQVVAEHANTGDDGSLGKLPAYTRSISNSI